MNNLITTGIVCPVTNQIFAAGVDWHASRSLPHRVEVVVDSSEKKVRVDVSVAN
jgi:hypothetical protein